MTPQLFIFINVYVVSFVFFFLAVRIFSSKMILLQFEPFFTPPPLPSRFSTPLSGVLL